MQQLIVPFWEDVSWEGKLVGWGLDLNSSFNVTHTKWQASSVLPYSGSFAQAKVRWIGPNISTNWLKEINKLLFYMVMSLKKMCEFLTQAPCFLWYDSLWVNKKYLGLVNRFARHSVAWKSWQITGADITVIFPLFFFHKICPFLF